VLKFDEELAKFKPVALLDEIEETIKRSDNQDLSILLKLLKSNTNILDAKQN